MFQPGGHFRRQMGQGLVNDNEMGKGIPLAGKAESFFTCFEIDLRSGFFANYGYNIDIQIFDQFCYQRFRFHTQFQVPKGRTVVFPGFYVTESDGTQRVRFDSPGILAGAFGHQQGGVLNPVPAPVGIMRLPNAGSVRRNKIAVGDLGLLLQLFIHRTGLVRECGEILLLPGFAEGWVSGQIFGMGFQQRYLQGHAVMPLKAGLLHNAGQVLV
ncbi:MAG: hypothetical protein BWY71_01341 [Planctomycetes bacterium ADurb.Bin412]|nr:MAG: hypothetical protein BWY71_01341 [Planctomycetes bacterium ADurb.Bin412]